VATKSVSAVLFAKSLHRVSPFYREVLGAKTLDRSERHESLECQGFHLLLQKIPDALAESIEISTPPDRREQTAIRLNFPVADIEAARLSARRLGGHIDDVPPPWAGTSTHFYLGYDPEGNVIGLMPANTSFERTREG
jgi:predicted enzyme related to lactoylglutathione lyase